MTGWHALSAHGPTVVLVHGLEGSWRDWTAIAPLLAPDYHLVALDLPWHAGNDYTWRGERTPGQWLDEALSALPQPVHAIVAHSFGANATLELLSTGATFERVALLAPLYPPKGLPADDALRAESRHALASAVRAGLRLRVDTARLRPQVLADMERKLVEYVLPRAFPPFFDCLMATAELPLSTVDTDTLVLAGTTDVSLPPAAAQSLSTAFPAAEVRQRTHYTHFCHVEQAAETAAELTEFLRTS